jgi:hypothetical protein
MGLSWFVIVQLGLGTSLGTESKWPAFKNMNRVVSHMFLEVIHCTGSWLWFGR